MDNLGELRLDLRLERRREVPTGSRSSWEKESKTARSISGSSMTDPVLGLRLAGRRPSFLDALLRVVAISETPSIVLMSPGKWSSKPAPKSVSATHEHQRKLFSGFCSAFMNINGSFQLTIVDIRRIKNIGELPPVVTVRFRSSFKMLQEVTLHAHHVGNR